jgi:hypothetical protein
LVIERSLRGVEYCKSLEKGIVGVVKRDHPQKEPYMDNRIPLRLRKEPLLEAIWEIRFSSWNSSVADLLPGMLFKSFPGKFS